MKIFPLTKNKYPAAIGKESFLIIIFTVLSLLAGCSAPQIRLFTDNTFPLKEFVLQGTEKGKVAIIPVHGIITDVPQSGIIRQKPSMVQEIVSQIRLAESDEEVKALLLAINTPGGTVTASDILYREIVKFKKETGGKVVVSMMDLATSGGYYIALSSDYITAHPTTVTGSVGALFLRPKVSGLMEKVGVDVEISKSGKNKDMGSPFRKSTGDEKDIFQGLIDEMAGRFKNILVENRKIDESHFNDIFSARVYHSADALKLGLIDEICYLDEAIASAKEIAGLTDNAKVVVYRRTEYPDDNVYNTAINRYGYKNPALINPGILSPLINLPAGFYYLWLPALGK